MKTPVFYNSLFITAKLIRVLFLFGGKKGKKLRHTCLNEILVSKFADAYIPKSLGNCIVSGADIRVWRPN